MRVNEAISKNRLAVLAYNLIVLGEDVLNVSSKNKSKSEVNIIARTFSKAFTDITADDYFTIINHDFSDVNANINIGYDNIKDFVIVAYGAVKSEYEYSDERMQIEVGIEPEECKVLGLN